VKRSDGKVTPINGSLSPFRLVFLPVAPLLNVFLRHLLLMNPYK
jgi:hypothetical protein